MFLLTQFMGLLVLNAGLLDTKVGEEKTIGEAIGIPTVENTKQQTNLFFTGIIPAFIIAILLLILLMRFKIEAILRLWFFLVVTIALILSSLSIINLMPWFEISLQNAIIISLLIALPLAFIKIFRRNIFVHNFTEFFIYPGIAIIFVPLLNIYTIIALLILISLYDMWAVWKSGIMQKMAKYQIKKVGVFSGFFVPYLSKKQKLELEKMRKSKSKKSKEMKVNVAILGGGDVVFPIITAGVMLKAFGLLPAILVILGATLGLGYLFLLAEKKKFYPAMPFITIGIFIGMALSWLLF